LGSLKVEFVRGSGMGGGIGSILYSLRGVTNEFFSYNAVGHTVALTLTDGSAEKTDLYEAFGNIASTAGAAENNRLANTKERSFSIGLDNHGFRYYDPEVGRYLTRDPIGYGDGMNVYLYVGNNPINHLDPEGLSAIGDFFSEAGRQTANLALRAGKGIVEGGLVVSDMMGYGTAAASGAGGEYEGHSDLFKSIYKNPTAMGDPNEVRGKIAVDGIKRTLTLGMWNAAEASGEAAATGDWNKAQDEWLGSALLWSGARSGSGSKAKTPAQGDTSLNSSVNNTSATQNGNVQAGGSIEIPKGSSQKSVAPSESVKSENGGVDFTGSDDLYPAGLGQKNIVKITYTGSRRQDFGAANQAAGTGATQKPPAGYTWHHLDDYDSESNTGTMQLVKRLAHEETYPHKGGVRQYEAATGNEYK
jgi:RHS repeat-associated protein